MSSHSQKPVKKNEWSFTSAPIVRRFALLGLAVVILVALGGVVLSINQMQERSALLTYQLEEKSASLVAESVTLLESLAVQQRFVDSAVPVEEKISELNLVNEQFGYLMIRYVDENMDVWSERGPTSLATRDYMQRLFVTGQVQVTDSFPSGADGATLNYTIAAPIKNNGEVVGAVFCAIYFDEFIKMFETDSNNMQAESLLLGSQNQIMSATDGSPYGELYLDNVRTETNFGTTAALIEEGFLTKAEGSYWKINNGHLGQVSYSPVEGTQWTLVCTVDFWENFQRLLPIIIGLSAAVLVLFALVMWLTHRFITAKLTVVDQLVESVQDLERKIYQSDRPDRAGFQDIIRLTSGGLSDGLTGVATRAVFLNQLDGLLERTGPDKLVSLCFIDMDDLKSMNDTHGHEIGDIALKSIGYVLQEYEKKYAGLVGRYGGDEFVLALTDIDSFVELREVIGELALRLHLSTTHEGVEIPIKCSVGVSIWDRTSDINATIREADEALYIVKHNGKSHYCIYQDRTS